MILSRHKAYTRAQSPFPMTEEAKRPVEHVEIVPAASEHATILANLLELYVHDFSEFLKVTIRADGRFGYESLPLYWSEPGRQAFLVRVDGSLAGLALVKRGSELSGDDGAWDMAEFFVLRAYRRHGIGTQIAHEVWRRFPGNWEVRVMQANVSAEHFWAHAISEYVGEVVHPVRVEKNGECWNLFSFESKHSL
jgi:predicted acetyltransferase